MKEAVSLFVVWMAIVAVVLVVIAFALEQCSLLQLVVVVVGMAVACTLQLTVINHL